MLISIKNITYNDLINDNIQHIYIYILEINLKRIFYLMKVQNVIKL